MSRNERINASKAHVLAASTFAGLFARFVIAPLDVIKIRLQLQPHGTGKLKNAVINGPSYRGIYGTARTVVAQEGITGLWKGNIPAEFLYMSYTAAQFLSYRAVNVAIRDSELGLPEAVRNSVAGGTAGAIATTATYPFDLLRTRFAAQGTQRVYSSIVHSVCSIYQQEGPRGFFRGVGVTVFQIVPSSAIFFGAYETIHNFNTDINYFPIGWADASSGALASIVAKTSIFPLDLIRRRLQVQGPTRGQYVHRNIPLYNSGIFSAVRAIAKVEGARGLYKGLLAALVKSAPSSAVTMWSYESALRLLKWLDPNDDDRRRF